MGMIPRYIQWITFGVHILTCILALYIFKRREEWKYFATMLLVTNIVGVIYYGALFYIPDFEGHVFSRIRALLQTLAWFVFSYYMVFYKDKE